jgi:hypothetical protein
MARLGLTKMSAIWQLSGVQRTAFGAGIQDMQLNPESASRCLHVVRVGLGKSAIGRVDEAMTLAVGTSSCSNCSRFGPTSTYDGKWHLGDAQLIRKRIRADTARCPGRGAFCAAPILGGLHHQHGRA